MWNLFTNNEVRKERMAICNSCEYKSEKYLLIFNGAGCSLCKCP